MRLQEIRQRYVRNQALLRLEPVDRRFAVLEKFLEQIAADEVLKLLAQRDGLDELR